ncbi:UNVERIFIED_CONTAM: hypothetical protein RMT77_011362 [Armadillidium vulgare]
MDKKFQAIYFDLSQNLVSLYAVEKLQDYALLLCVCNCMKNNVTAEDINKMISSQTDGLNLRGVSFSSDFLSFLKMILCKVKKCIGSNINFSDDFIERVVYVLMSEIIDFFKIIDFPTLDGINLLLKHLVITHQGTVNTMKTVTGIFQEEKIAINNKFYFAAEFCLEDIVTECYSMLSNSERKYYTNVKIEDNYMTYFWVAQFTTFKETIRSLEAHGLSKNMKRKNNVQRKKFASMVQNVFEKAVKDYREMAVYYLWNKYISKMSERETIVKRVIYPYINKKCNQTKIVMFLILETRTDEMTTFFDEKGFKILILTFIPRWHILFFIFFTILKSHFKDEVYKKIFCELITNYRCQNNFTLVHFFRIIPNSVKNMLSETPESQEMYFNLLSLPFQFSREDLLYSILIDKEKVFTFFLSSSGLNLFEISIRNLRFEFANKVLYKYLNEEQVTIIKCKIFDSKAFSLFAGLVNCGLYTLNELVNWFSGSVKESKIQDFKSQFPYRFGGYVINKTLFPIRSSGSISIPIEYTECILCWCLGRKNLQSVKRNIYLHIEMKENICDNEQPIDFQIKCYKYVRNLILESKWQFLLILKIWKMCTTEDGKALFRKLLYDKRFWDKMLLKSNVLDYLKSFEKFFKENILLEQVDCFIDFKLKMLDQYEFFIDLLTKKCRIDIAKDIAMWCDPPTIILIRFKSRVYSKIIIHFSKKLVSKTLANDYLFNEGQELKSWLNNTNSDCKCKHRIKKKLLMGKKL